MSRFEAPPGIVTNGLVLNLDAGDPDSYTRSQPPYVEVLVVAGGGGGGGNNSNNYRSAGGGGGGGVIYNSAYQLTSAAAVTVTVGAGGAGIRRQASSGNDSVFGSLTAIGGGGGGGTTSTGDQNGLDGGSGGGGGDYNGNGGNGTAGQGFGGGNSRQAAGVGAGASGGGGGGAGGPGPDCINSYGAINGGPSVTYSISGTPTAYAYGGGSRAAGDTGNAAGVSGVANSGGGGGGARFNVGGNGGSGIVIVRYPGLPAATGGTITYLNGYTIHTFTSSDTFTPYLWNDLAGGISGEVKNGTDFVSPQNYFSFDGTDNYVQFPNTNALDNQSFTIEVWVRTNSLSQNGFWFEKGLVNTQYSLFQEGNNIVFRNREAGGSTFSLSVNAASYLNTTGWFQVVGAYTAGSKRLYVNATQITSDTTNITVSTNSGGIWVGVYGGTGNYYYNGDIAIVNVYNRDIGSTGITQNYNAQRARFGSPYVATSGLGSSGNPATSAQQLYDNGISQDGVYYINNGTTTVPTYCEFKNGEGWMLVMNIKSDYFGDSKLTWNDYNNWINFGEDLGTVFSPFLGGQYRNRDLYNYMPNEKWMIKVHNNGSEFDGGSWAAWELIEPGNTMVTIMNTPGQSGGGTQVTNDYYAQVGMGTSGYASGLFWCPIARTLGHLRVNHLLNNNGARILGSEQYLETSNTDRTRGLSNHYAIAGTALDNQGLSPWNSHVSPYVNTANTSPYSSNYRQFTTTVFPDSSNSNTATQGTVTLSDGRYMHYGIFIK